MNTEIQKNNKHRLELIKWIVVFILLVVAAIGNYLFDNISLIIRIVVTIILIATAGGIFLLTKKGKLAITFIHETHAEIHKVIWPTHRETLHATLIVIIVTIIVSLVLWGLDSILVHLVSFITT